MEKFQVWKSQIHVTWSIELTVYASQRNRLFLAGHKTRQRKTDIKIFDNTILEIVFF